MCLFSTLPESFTNVNSGLSYIAPGFLDHSYICHVALFMYRVFHKVMIGYPWLRSHKDKLTDHESVCMFACRELSISVPNCA